MTLGDWLEKGKHLPPSMQDFHDQKDLFKAIHETLKNSESCKEVDWRTAMCYTIDVFLWFMAFHGYTLQKSRANLTFGDLHAQVEKCRQERNEIFRQVLEQELNKNREEESK